MPTQALSASTADLADGSAELGTAKHVELQHHRPDLGCEIAKAIERHAGVQHTVISCGSKAFTSAVHKYASRSSARSFNITWQL